MEKTGAGALADEGDAPQAQADVLRAPSGRSQHGQILSDLAVSPFAMSLPLLHEPVRVAWIGRTSTEDQQDPRNSLMRQLDRCKGVLPESWLLACHFYDVESGRMQLEKRGQKEGYERYDIPISRDGGISDLLAEARSPHRRFDVVICESTSRVARGMLENLSIERRLEQAGVRLFAWNEPIKIDGGRAQQILQRRINQSVAEYEVYNSLETAWGGLCAHVREGWNIGKPPYGYTAKIYRRPNPVRARRGAAKTRLEPDGLKAQTVTQIAHWRYYERLGYGAIADRLNAEPARFPPPEPPGGLRARGVWGKSAVYEILRNPKYTGFQVFNRRATHSGSGKVNDPAMWVWSPYPVHEPLIPKWMFDEIASRRRHRPAADSDTRPNDRPVQRAYVLRGMVVCPCGRRLHGNQRHGVTYYVCWPKGNNRGRPDAYAPHPKTRYISETDLMKAATAFYAEHVLAAHRWQPLAADLALLDDRALQDRQEERERCQRALDAITRRQENIRVQSQHLPATDPYTRGLRDDYNDLERCKQASVAALAHLETARESEIEQGSIHRANLVAAIPYLARNLAAAPEALLRRLFELTSLQFQLSGDGSTPSVSGVLPAGYELPRSSLIPNGVCQGLQ
ncbi:recombinase family protein [Streptomyces sp. NPDC051976]|uniref:recombinase family protein n=1 Tax=Streptomyces sp. NPDC051976 TaxID=3154947 RepID=UPI003429D923